MHLFNHPIKARFLDRPNRFLVQCTWNGRTLTAFLPNPGRLQELLVPGRLIYFVKEEESEHRKTRFTAVAVERDGYPIMLHTFRTNEVAAYLLQKGKIRGLENVRIVKSEVRIGQNRFDFLLADGEKLILIRR